MRAADARTELELEEAQRTREVNRYAEAWIDASQAAEAADEHLRRANARATELRGAARFDPDALLELVCAESDATGAEANRSQALEAQRNAEWHMDRLGDFFARALPRLDPAPALDVPDDGPSPDEPAEVPHPDAQAHPGNGEPTCLRDDCRNFHGLRNGWCYLHDPERA